MIMCIKEIEGEFIVMNTKGKHDTTTNNLRAQVSCVCCQLINKSHEGTKSANNAWTKSSQQRQDKWM